MTLRLARVTFRFWFIDHFNLTPFDLSINKWSINWYTRLFYVVFHLEISTGLLEKLEKQHDRSREQRKETDGTA